MTAPYQVVTSTAQTALSYAPEQRIITLCDGSLLVVTYDGTTSAKLTQITNPSGTSPTMTALSQSFSLAGSGNTVASLYVLHNGSTSDDVWVVYGDNSGNTSLISVAHGTYTASGATWSWDNTGTSLVSVFGTDGFFVPSIIWTGTYLIVATRALAANWDVTYTYTTTKNGSGGWAAVVNVETLVGSSHCYPILLHDATNGCSVMVYAMAADTVYARVLPDASSPALANWSAHVALSGTVGVGAANLTAALDTASKKLHVAWCDSTASPNPHYVVSTYTTTTITPGTAFAITGGGGTGATGPTIAIDNSATPKVWLFWASAAAGAASDISYVNIASPYASGNVSAVTNKTALSTNDNVFPHVPQQEPMSGGYVPLIYLRSVTNPYPIEFDNTITLTSILTGAATLSGKGAYSATGLATGVGAASLSGHGAYAATGHEVLTAAASLAGHGAYLASLTVPGTGIGDLAVTTKSQSWSGGPTGSPGTETDITYEDAGGSGWAVGLIPTYGGAPISSWYEVDAATAGANQTSLTTSTPDGHLHWLEQSSGAVFAGSEDLPFTLTEQAPTGTAFRRYYKATLGPDANGFNWNVYACIYPGDPGFIAYRFDCINPTGSAIPLAGADGMEIALIGALQQNDATWAPANGFYGSVGGSPTTGWPSSLTTADPDYVGIAPASGSGVKVGVATIKQKAVTAFSPAWSSAQIQYLQNASRLKLKVQGTLSSFPGSTTSTVYLLNVRRRNLTAADTAAIAADYLAPGTPTMTAGSYTTFSPDERAYVFAASAGNTLGATLDLSPAHVTARFKPVLKITGWTGGAPILAWGGSALTAGVDYRHAEDVANSVLYVQLYFDVVASGAALGQRNNAALSIQPGVVSAVATLKGHGAYSATGHETLTALATLKGHGAFGVSGAYLTYLGAASLKGRGAYSATGHEVLAKAATLSGHGAFVAGSVQVVTGAASLSGHGAYSAQGVQVVSATVALKGHGAYAATGSATYTGVATLHGHGAFTATGHVILSASATLRGHGAFQVNSQELIGGAASLSGRGGFGARGIQVVSKSAALAGHAAFTARGIQVVSKAAALAGRGAFVAGSVQTLAGAATLAGRGASLARGGPSLAPGLVTLRDSALASVALSDLIAEPVGSGG